MTEPDNTDGMDGTTGLAALLEDLATEFPDVEARPGPAGTDYIVGAQPFARLQGEVAEFRLRPEIVAAAVRTGDAVPSPLGQEWVRFRPATFDQYAVDRAQAWFELGHRLAAAVTRRH
jgi:hypothetical protein